MFRIPVQMCRDFRGKTRSHEHISPFNLGLLNPGLQFTHASLAQFQHRESNSLCRYRRTQIAKEKIVTALVRQQASGLWHLFGCEDSLNMCGGSWAERYHGASIWSLTVELSSSYVPAKGRTWHGHCLWPKANKAIAVTRTGVCCSDFVRHGKYS